MRTFMTIRRSGRSKTPPEIHHARGSNPAGDATHWTSANLQRISGRCPIAWSAGGLPTHSELNPRGGQRLAI